MSRRNGNAGLKALAAIMSVLFILLAVAGVVAYFSDWFTNWDNFKTEQEEPTEETANGGMLIGESEGTGVSLLSEKIATADYAAYGVSPLAESAYTLTATVEPANAPDKAVDWSVAFVNPSSEWATGKTVTDYVTVTPTSDGALTATVQNMKAFGEQIKVTVTHRENENATASCTVDFAKKLKGVRFYEDSYFDFTIGVDEEACHPTYTLNPGSTGTPTYEFLFSDYTLDDSFTYTLNAVIDSEFLFAFRMLLADEPFMPSMTNSSSFTFNGTKFVKDGNNSLAFYFYPDEMAFINIGTPTSYNGAVFGGNAKYHNVIGSILDDNLDCYYYDLTLTATGTYSDFSATIKVVPNRENYEYKVTSLNLNESTLVF